MTGDFFAEMAACPQHSYLLRQQIAPTFEGAAIGTESPNATEVVACQVEAPPVSFLLK